MPCAIRDPMSLLKDTVVRFFTGLNGIELSMALQALAFPFIVIFTEIFPYYGSDYSLFTCRRIALRRHFFAIELL